MCLLLIEAVSKNFSLGFKSDDTEMYEISIDALILRSKRNTLSIQVLNEESHVHSEQETKHCLLAWRQVILKHNESML